MQRLELWILLRFGDIVIRYEGDDWLRPRNSGHGRQEARDIKGA
jgi:hypothetical protein